MAATPTAVLAHLDPVRRVALGLIGLVVTPLALGAGERDDGPVLGFGHWILVLDLGDGAGADVITLRRSGGWYEGLTEDYLTVYTPTDRVVPARFGAVLRHAGDGTLQAEP